MKDKRLGNKLNEKRKALGLKTEELAMKCGIEPGYMRQILSGQVPSGQVLLRLCDVLKLSPNYLYEYEGEAEDKEIIQALNKLDIKEKRVVLHLINSYIQMHGE